MASVSVLLGSGGLATEERRSLYRDLATEHFSGCETVLFVPYAAEDWAGYTERMRGFQGDGGPDLVGIESHEDHSEALASADAIYVGGGNSFLLIRELHERGLLGPMRDKVLSGTPYLGVSAGANVACPSMMTTNDMPIVLPPSFDSLGIVPFQINPHYYPGKILYRDGNEVKQHFGETRARRISEFHGQFKIPVLGMWEGSFVQWDGSRGLLTGRATVFRPNQEPFMVESGAEFDGDLAGEE